MAELCVYRGDHEAAGDLVGRALQVADDPPMAPHVLARTYATAALNHLETGDPKTAAQMLVEAGAVAERTGHCATCNALVSFSAPS
jgi:hypothetical protein